MGNKIEKGMSKVSRLKRALGKESLNTLERLYASIFPIVSDRH